MVFHETNQRVEVWLPPGSDRGRIEAPAGRVRELERLFDQNGINWDSYGAEIKFGDDPWIVVYYLDRGEDVARVQAVLDSVP